VGIGATKIETRSRPPPPDKIEPEQDAGCSLAEYVFRSKPDLQDANYSALVIDDCRSARSFGSEHLDGDPGRAFGSPSDEESSLVEAQAVAERIPDHRQVGAGRR
jgi:hypothetical protein